MIIEVDKKSGFCFGVRNAIKKAEELAANESDVISLGEIVHNENENERLQSIGISSMQLGELDNFSDKTVLIRTHGEAPSTYERLRQNNNKIIDATCPVVLKLQERIKKSYAEMQKINGQIVIFGKEKHPEVIGLNGQTQDKSIVVGGVSELSKVDFSRPVELYCQTTMPLDGFEEIKTELKEKMNSELVIHDTICRQVANRVPHLKKFVSAFDLVIFVSGSASSNGKFLFSICKAVNENTYFVSSVDQIKPEWFHPDSTVGICGATSTPQWLMEDVKDHIENIFVL